MYLFLQLRTDESGWHEYKCLYESTGLRYNDFFQVNLSSHFITQEKLHAYLYESKAIIIGGLAELSYGETDPLKKEQFDTARHKIIPLLKQLLIDKPDKKILGMCLGHQIVAEALGAPVGYAPEQTEVGVKTVFLTDEGRNDPLFDGIENPFPAILGHKDAIFSLPEHATRLAYSEKCDIQAFKVGKAVYGVQFHPELEYEDLQWRLAIGTNASYKKHYTNPEEKIEISTRKVIKNFINL